MFTGRGSRKASPRSFRALFVSWAFHSDSRPVQHMGIDHGCRHVRMAEKLLDGPDIIPGFEQMGGERMPECMHACSRRQPCRFGSHPDGFLENRFMNMVTNDPFCRRLHTKPGCRKDILTAPFLMGIGIFHAEGARQADRSEPLGEIRFVKLLHGHEMLPERFDDFSW